MNATVIHNTTTRFSVLLLMSLFLAMLLLPDTGHTARHTSFTGPGGRTSTKNTGWVRTPTGAQRSSTVTGPNGNSATGNTFIAPTNNGYNAHTTVTGPGGQSVNRNSTGSWDPVTKTWTKSTTSTGPNQNSYSKSRSTTFSK